MSIDFTLSFDGLEAAKCLQAEYADVIDALSDMVLETARANLGGDYPEVADALRSSLASLAEMGSISGTIEADHWKALMAEWGSGSDMDLANPAIEAYVNSPYWNPDRDGTAITGRDAGAYLGLDGEMHDKHSGLLAGVDLEELSKNDPKFQNWMASVGLPADAFQPKRPLHFMAFAMLSNRSFIEDQLKAVIEKFNFGDFFV